MEVFRIQDAEGRGPWKPGFSQVWVEDREDHDNLPPWFIEFGDIRNKMIVGMWMGSACRTIEQLRRWFTPTEYATLRSLGYQAVKLEAGRILAESHRQCVFERSRALNVNAVPFDLYEAKETEQAA